jgi:putative ABC transport system ATP-binding protein
LELERVGTEPDEGALEQARDARMTTTIETERSQQYTPDRSIEAAEPTIGPVMVALDNVSKTVQSGSAPLTILRDATVEIRSGEFVAVMGPSGSGKSTLLGLVAGLDAPSSGRIVVDGAVVTELSEAELARLRGTTIGFVFQAFHLIPSMTALENVAIPMELQGRRDALVRARELLADVGLGERAHHYPSQLSGGEQQRVAIARAFANDPKLLLADEPTGNLDSAMGRLVIDLLVQLNVSRQTTLLLVTHDAEIAARAPRCLVLRDGHIVEDRRQPR